MPKLTLLDKAKIYSWAEKYADEIRGGKYTTQYLADIATDVTGKRIGKNQIAPLLRHLGIQYRKPAAAAPVYAITLDTTKKLDMITRVIHELRERIGKIESFIARIAPQEKQEIEHNKTYDLNRSEA